MPPVGRKYYDDSVRDELIRAVGCLAPSQGRAMADTDLADSERAREYLEVDDEPRPINGLDGCRRQQQLANHSHTTATANAVATPENDAISVDNSRPASTPTSSIQRQTESFTTEALVPPERAVIHLIARPDFYATTLEVLNQLFLNIVRDLVDTESVFVEDTEAATHTDAKA